MKVVWCDKFHNIWYVRDLHTFFSLKLKDRNVAIKWHFQNIKLSKIDAFYFRKFVRVPNDIFDIWLSYKKMRDVEKKKRQKTKTQS